MINAVYFLGTVVVVLLFIGCVNFINLSTARSDRRTKEIGIRKVAGASRAALIWQFLVESILLAFMAAIIALLLAQIALPYFNSLVQQNLRIGYGCWQFWAAAIAFIGIIGILAGSYPAFYLSSYRISPILKNPVGIQHPKLTLRKTMVVAQFVIAIIMINYSFAMYRQTNLVSKRDTGFAIDSLLFHPLTKELATTFEIVKNELFNTGGVLAVNRAGSPLSRSGSAIAAIRFNGQKVIGGFELMTADQDFIGTNGLQLINGRDINTGKFPMDSNSCLLNKSATIALGNKNPIGQIIVVDSLPLLIVGTMDDFINGNPFQEPNPLIVKGSKAGNFIIIRVKDPKAENQWSKFSAILKKYNTNGVTELQFMSTDYAQKLRGVKTTLGLAAGFTICAIFISCLGILGLGAFMAESRKKEIGIRKVLGASVSSIVGLLTRDFMRLVIISVLIASPIAWIIVSIALQNFYYRINLGWWMLPFTALLAIVITLVTLSFVTIKASLAVSPDLLKSE